MDYVIVESSLIRAAHILAMGPGFCVAAGAGQESGGVETGMDDARWRSGRRNRVPISYLIPTPLTVDSFSVRG